MATLALNLRFMSLLSILRLESEPTRLLMLRLRRNDVGTKFYAEESDRALRTLEILYRRLPLLRLLLPQAVRRPMHPLPMSTCPMRLQAQFPKSFALPPNSISRLVPLKSRKHSWTHLCNC